MKMLSCPNCNASKRQIKKKTYSGGCAEQLFLLGAILTPVIGWAWLLFFWKPRYQHTCKKCGAQWISEN